MMISYQTRKCYDHKILWKYEWSRDSDNVGSCLSANMSILSVWTEVFNNIRNLSLWEGDWLENLGRKADNIERNSFSDIFYIVARNYIRMKLFFKYFCKNLKMLVSWRIDKDPEETV